METEDVVNAELDGTTTSHRNPFQKLKASLALKRRSGSNFSHLSMTGSGEDDALANNHFQERESSREEPPKTNDDGNSGRKVSIDQTVITLQDLSRSFGDRTVLDSTNSHPPGKNIIEGSTSTPTATTNTVRPNIIRSSPINTPPVLPSNTVWARGDPGNAMDSQAHARMGCARTLHAPPPHQHRLDTHRQLDPALQARIEAVHIQERLLGVHHPDVIFAFSSLEKLFARRGMYLEANQIRMAAQRRSFQAIQTAATGGQMRSDIEEPPANIPAEITFQHENSSSR